ncbi:MAG TPA: abortive phage infection protein [Candidatus Mediterraneibacter faecavium]|uniref:Abortive phage infection protein n=1 Tax=Candidatus Mediterraneibacter faecavium TaxID=2838668 RepID=A0A9D2TNQ3_9FIRM|nr:abortive phage infection protein [Candidatus Mediterraneibacter faecavium]
MKDMDDLIKMYDYLTPMMAQKSGISKFKFYKYVQEKGLDQVRRGVYVAGNEWVDELYVIHQRCSRAVFSHDEAFYYHNLTDREPLIHTFTIYSGYNAHRLVADGRCKAYTVKKELLDVGKIMVNDNDGNIIPMYDLERTVCDLMRSRKSIEIQEFNSVLKSYVARKDKNLNRLMQYAKLFRVDNIIRRYMEVLL